MTVQMVPFPQLLSCIVDNRGKTCPTAVAGIPLIATNCIRNELLYPTFEKVRYVDADTYREWFRGHPQAGDILVVTKGTPGRVCLVPDPVPFCIAQDMVAVRADPKKIDPKYLLAALRSTDTQIAIETMHVGSLIPHFKKGDFDKLLLPLPNRKAQAFIGETYFQLSAKIDLNRRMNETLEAMARAVYRSWFVDFDPVRAKANGRTPAGMDAPTAALFPDRFTDSPLGPLPAGWQWVPLGDLITLQRGRTYKSSLKELPGPYLLGLASIERNGGFRDANLTTYGGDSPEAMLLRTGDLFVSLKDVTQSADLLGAVARVPPHIGLGRLTQDTVKLIFRGKQCSPAIVYHTLLSQEYRDHCRSCATGTTNLGLRREDFLSYPIILPSESIQTRFDALVDSLQRRLDVNCEESVTLTAIRDSLLPRLLSGELRVPEAETIAEAAT